MQYRSLAPLLFVLACVPAQEVTSEQRMGTDMNITAVFEKNGQGFDIGKPHQPSEFEGVIALISLSNTTSQAVSFPCRFLQEQGLWVTYRLADYPQVLPHSIGTAPVSEAVKSETVQLSEGQACTVRHFMEPEAISDLFNDQQRDMANLQIEFTVPKDSAFGAASGEATSVKIMIRR